ncbi:aminoglycoside phosphotransferase family protein [Auraticoccus monumenti]|uniref:Predicted kinase, aminoglycoside phosphotransferase (APT) family n=1 Tax=Auraticoccus monumenti TaxID=675864 RepID=A0A1G6XTZ3_9ACTN|nr:aminoglycoside phosphotransferase family protein [Auraticoccus monumenti]SDD81648.1 Predicted kinase, aminoglycoside phosphotransferase (APT) family [Auraticoccus monumenti]
MTSTPDPGPPPERVVVGAEEARRLVAAQFPRWADLPVAPVPDGGWDNCTFRLGGEMLLRLPSAAPYARAVEKEHRWLPVLAPRLPLPVPVPLARGRPTADFPHPWSVYRWLEGVPATARRVVDPVRFAVDLADFLLALQRVDPAGGPQPGLHSWYRGAPVRTYDGETRRAIEALEGRVDVELAGEIWETALAARWEGGDVWFHGDVAEGNLLLRDGRLAAVIDFGTCGVGDPACDLAAAWTLLTAEGRIAFRERLQVDGSAWARGRGWALWKTLTTVAGAVHEPGSTGVPTSATQVLDAIFSEYRDSGSAG